MRLTMSIWWSLAVLWLVTSQGATAEPAPDAEPLREEVKGLGLTQELAKQDAVRAARERLQELLRQHEPPLVHWQPSDAFVEKHLIKGAGRPGAQGEFEKIGPTKSWVVTLEVPGDMTLVSWDRAAERDALAEQRLSRALHVVAGLFVLLSVGVGYVRLDEYTRSRYTGWLRAASAAVLLLAGAGWWCSH
jgi:hypothetical protein